VSAKFHDILIFLDLAFLLAVVRQGDAEPNCN